MARPKLGDGETQRLQLKISDEELGAIDDWRFANRVPSRSEAVRRLVQIALIFEIEGPKLSRALHQFNQIEKDSSNLYGEWFASLDRRLSGNEEEIDAKVSDLNRLSMRAKLNLSLAVLSILGPIGIIKQIDQEVLEQIKIAKREQEEFLEIEKILHKQETGDA